MRFKDWFWTVSLVGVMGLSFCSGGRKTLVAHRGASAYAPEHTLEAYRLAIEQGADYVEQDLQITRDGVLVCIHDRSLERTTNVEEVFPDRYSLPWLEQAGEKTWWVADFTLEEVRQLDAGSWFDPGFEGLRVPTFREAVEFIDGRAGLFPELKDPEFYAARGLDMVGLFLEALQAEGLPQPSGGSRPVVVVQSFSVSTLQRLAGQKVPWPLVLLVSRSGSEWLTQDGIRTAAGFVSGLGPDKSLVRDNPSLVDWAHENGVTVTPYTFRSAQVGDGFAGVGEEMGYFLETLNVDGLFTDNPDLFPR